MFQAKIHISVLAAFPVLASAQVINGYAQVTGIAGSVLTIGTSNETAATFTVGKEVVIMQMQDDVVGPNLSNNTAFGDLHNIQSAGRYAPARIAQVNRSGVTLTGLVLDAPPPVAFHFNANASVQVITFEERGGGGNYTTTSAMAALPWNGMLGGVLALQVKGTLTLDHNITADGAGFRGGARDRFSSTAPCNTTDLFWSSTASGTEYFASKGEGIHRTTNTAIADGRGKMLNAGGGANAINAGGGGGGNYTSGGSATQGSNCAGTAGGIGGIGLSSHISASRIFMGGGGGGGEGNDDLSTDGANGGGIVLIRAGRIRTSGVCLGRRISADGGNASPSGSDGAGGGGGGGSIVLEVPQFSSSSLCSMTIRANGGNGGSVINAATHGGGAGGGQGTVIFSATAPTGNISVATSNGTGGCNQLLCGNQAGSGTGTNGSGIIIGSVGPLPVELIGFEAWANGPNVQLAWSTASERNNRTFTVQRSMDLATWEDVVHVPGAIDSQEHLDYTAVDERPFPNVSYYRLLQTDLDGTSSFSQVVAVMVTESAVADMLLFPNPADQGLTVVHPGLHALSRLRVLDAVGRAVDAPITVREGAAHVLVANLVEGIYFVELLERDRRSVQKARVQRRTGL